MTDNKIIENIDILWQKVKDNIQEELSEQSYQTWIEPVGIASIADNDVTLTVPDTFYKDWLRERYQNLIESSFSVLLGTKPVISYKITEIEKKESVETQHQKNTSRQIKTAENKNTDDKDITNTYIKPQNTFKNSKYTFDTFVVGGSCRFAHAAGRAVAEAPAKKYNPLFIYGQVGLGKTHLMQAIAYEASQKFPGITTQYISSEKFTNGLINAIQNRSTMEFRKKFRNVDILLIDDIHFIAGKEATQEEFFHTFNDLYDKQKQIVLTSDRPPKDIPGLEDRLVSRFEWGLVTDIQPPDFETRVAILRKKMEKETVSVSDEVAFFIASKIKSNIRELEGALIRVVAYSQLIGQPITLSLTQDVLKDTLSEEEKKITIDAVQNKTSEYFNIALSDMRTSKRSRNLVYARQIAMYLIRQMTEHSLPEIGQYFGGRDHTTVLHAISKIENKTKSDLSTQRAITDITNMLKN